MDQERLLDALATWCKARYGRQRQLAQGDRGYRADGQRLDRPPKDARETWQRSLPVISGGVSISCSAFNHVNRPVNIHRDVLPTMLCVPMMI
jgi:hypothetical protein